MARARVPAHSADMRCWRILGVCAVVEKGETMVNAFSVSVEVAVTPDKAWAVIGDPCAVPRWYPTYVSCVVEGGVRTLRRADGGEMVERLLERDEAGYSYAYSVVSGVPLRSHRASFTVQPSEIGSRIIWHTEAEHEDPEIDMEARLADRQREALQGLKTLLEAGHTA
jgi:hypothetical protein